MLLKSDVTHRDHVSVVMDPMNAGSRIVNFIVNFICDGTVFATLKYTTLVHMRSGYMYAWTMKSWQRSEWRLGFNSVLCIVTFDQIWEYREHMYVLEKLGVSEFKL